MDNEVWSEREQLLCDLSDQVRDSKEKSLVKKSEDTAKADRLANDGAKIRDEAMKGLTKKATNAGTATAKSGEKHFQFVVRTIRIFVIGFQKCD